MTPLTLTRLVESTPERVFAAFTDLANASKLVRGIKSLEVLGDGTVGAGTRFRETRIMFGKECTEELVLTAFDAPKTYTVGCKSSGSEFTTVFRFTPEGDGTRVDLELTMRPLTFLAKVASPMSTMMLQACMKAIGEDIDDLAAVAEGKAASAPARALDR